MTPPSMLFLAHLGALQQALLAPGLRMTASSAWEIMDPHGHEPGETLAARGAQHGTSTSQLDKHHDRRLLCRAHPSICRFEGLFVLGRTRLGKTR